MLNKLVMLRLLLRKRCSLLIRKQYAMYANIIALIVWNDTMRYPVTTESFHENDTTITVASVIWFQVSEIYTARRNKRLRNDLLTLSRFLTVTYLKIPLILIHRFTIALTVFNISMKNFEWVANESLRITKMRYHFDRDRIEERIVIQICREEFFSGSTYKIQ